MMKLPVICTVLFLTKKIKRKTIFHKNTYIETFQYYKPLKYVRTYEKDGRESWWLLQFFATIILRYMIHIETCLHE